MYGRGPHPSGLPSPVRVDPTECEETDRGTSVRREVVPPQSHRPGEYTRVRSTPHAGLVLVRSGFDVREKIGSGISVRRGKGGDN